MKKIINTVLFVLSFVVLLNADPGKPPLISRELEDALSHKDKNYTDERIRRIEAILKKDWKQANAVNGQNGVRVLSGFIIEHHDALDQEGFLRVVGVLIEHGALVDVGDVNLRRRLHPCNTPLHHAVNCNHYALAELLLRAQRNPNVLWRNLDGGIPSQLATTIEMRRLFTQYMPSSVLIHGVNPGYVVENPPWRSAPANISSEYGNNGGSGDISFGFLPEGSNPY